MRKYFAIIVLFFTVSTASAQIKYGHINSDEIMEAMPEFKQLRASLERKQREQENKVRAMYTDLQKRQQELQEYGEGLMLAVAEEKAIELDSLQKAIVAYQEGAGDELDNLRFKLLKPLNDKYLKIVNAVAKENGYTLILDESKGIVAYGNDSYDITALVKKKMGIN
jgi:outer membrane protein